MTLRTILLATAAMALASPVHAEVRSWFPHGSAGGGGGGGSSPTVTPGSTQPAYDATNSTSTVVMLTGVTVNSLAVSYHGTNTDNGYNIRTWARWDDLPFTFVSGIHHVGLLAAHPPTDAEKAAGTDNNVASVQVRCDRGSWFTITGPTANPDAGNTVDWNFTVNDSDYADGLHKCDAIVSPATGPDALMEGPPFDASGYETFSAGNVIIDNGAGTGVAGNVLTVDSGSPFIDWQGATASSVIVTVGMSVSARGVAPGTFIDGDHTNGNTDCGGGAGSCTGTGGTGTYHLRGPAQTVNGGQIIGKINNGASSAGTLLTVSSVTDGGLNLNLLYGSALYGSGVAAGTHITGANNQGGTNCAAQSGANCTGTGLAGTYTVNNSQNVAAGTTLRISTPATFNTERSFYFVTNKGRGIPRNIYYVCYSGTCNGVTGNDTTNDGKSAAAPFATAGKALAAAWAADTSTYHRGKYGATICILNGGVNFEYTNGTINPDAWLGYLDYQGANAAPCSAPSDPGGMAINQTTGGVLSTRGYFPTRTRWRYLSFNGTPTTASPGTSQYLVADHVTQTHNKLGDAQSTSAPPGLLASGAWMCLESTAYFGADGACSGAVMVRNTKAKYSYQDGLHDVPVAIGNTIDGDGNREQWVTATFHTATPGTLTNVTLLPSELAGYTLSSIFLGDGVNHSAQLASGTDCYTASAQVSSVNDGTHTLTLTSPTSSGACADGSTVYLVADGAHPDLHQLSGVNVFHDLFITGNSYNANYQAFNQGSFLESAYMDGLYLKGNTFKVDANDPGESMDAVNGGNENVVYSGNTWDGRSSFNHDAQMGSANQTFINDQCLSGGTLTPVQAGSNIRKLQGATSVCYTTTTP